MKIFKHLFSGWLMGVLLVAFAGVIGYATFVENDFGAQAAKLKVYNSKWFEFLLLLMIINFSGMIFTKHLYMKSKWNVLVIHLALIIIIIGAGVTRYFGSEGQMHIRDGKTASVYRSADAYFQIQLKKGEERFEDMEKIILSPASNKLFSKKYSWKNEKFKFIVSNYYPNSELVVVPSDQGDAYLTIVIGSPTGRKEIHIKEGETKILSGFGISFGDTTKGNILSIIRKGDTLFARFPEKSQVDPSGSKVAIQQFKPIEKMALQSIDGRNFLIKDLIPHGNLEHRISNSKGGEPIVKIIANGQDIMLPLDKEYTAKANDIEISLQVGHIALELPFEIKLNKFNLERYPGSNSPSSFVSDVTLIDQANQVEMPYSIYMNHILNYGGYRFFQSSYDNDEKGTILSVNHDYWGTLITYVGYFILFASLIATFFTNGSRFKRISHQLKEVHNARRKISSSLTVLFIMFGYSLFGQSGFISPEHAANFGELLIQNNEGRIEPVNTMANKILVKINKKNSFNGLSSDQVFLGIISDPEKWKNEPLIKVGDPTIQDIIGIENNYASFFDFIDEKGNYKILSEVEKANLKKPSTRSTYDKALISIDERVNVLYMVLSASVLRIFPLENDSTNSWVNPQKFHQIKGHGNENAELFDDYLNSLKEAIESNDYSIADKRIENIGQYQRQLAESISPSETATKLEVFYNKANIFKRLFPYYLSIGLLLVGIFFIQTFKPRYEFKLLTRIFFWVLLVAFTFQSFGLGIRWYISGHAPWSNGYESMIYISWATMLAGFLFMKKSPVTLGVTSVIAGITLLTAHMSWLNPEITNLVPVLKSYWLTIHVATITASYGFLALGCMMGFLNLIILIFRNKGNHISVNLTLKELTLIMEMAMSIGLILLIIGNFLGAIWANESWGRYWGWDPKETWTLVTIILYSFTLHLTLIPSIRNTFSFNFMSVISFGAVLMTYFGVNYYLSGLHSYAGGDPVQVPSFVFYSLGIFALVSILAAYKDFRFNTMAKAGKA